MNILKTLQALAQPGHRASPMAAAPPTPAPEPPPPVFLAPNAEPEDEDEPVLPPDVGLRDSVASGQYNNKTGELYPGFAITPDDIVLDVGCGDGDKAHFCAQRGAAIIFVDSDPGQVAIASKRLANSRAKSLTPIVSDTNPLPLESGIATRVIASEVIEHVYDPVAFLKELFRVGKPGALYLPTVPDPVCEGMQKKLAPPIHFQKPNHVRRIPGETRVGPLHLLYKRPELVRLGQPQSFGTFSCPLDESTGIVVPGARFHTNFKDAPQQGDRVIKRGCAGGGD